MLVSWRPSKRITRKRLKRGQAEIRAELLVFS